MTWKIVYNICKDDKTMEGKTKPKRKAGAKPIITNYPELVKVFLEGIRLGQTIRDAAEFANINPSTIFLWQSKGKQDLENGKRTKYVEFLEQFNRAKQQFIRNALSQIHKATGNDWKAAAYLLKMRYPKEYGDKQEVSINADEVGIKIINDIESDDE